MKKLLLPLALISAPGLIGMNALTVPSEDVSVLQSLFDRIEAEQKQVNDLKFLGQAPQFSRLKPVIVELIRIEF